MGRRAKGDGSLYKRSDGRWTAEANVTLTNGKVKRVIITGKKGENREDVRLKLRDLINNEERRIPCAEKDWSMDEYLDYWITEVHSKSIRESTLDTYKRSIKNHLKPTLGGHKLRNLSVGDVRNAIAAMEERGCGNGALEKSLQVLSACLKCAMREELIFRNVAQLVEKPTRARKETIVWSSEQAAYFLEFIKDHPFYIAFVLFFTYGMRRGEILGLRWQDIDFENGFIHVRQQIYRLNDKKIVARELKTKSSRRNPPLDEDVQAALIEHAKKRGIEIPPFNPHFELSKQGTVVVGKTGNPVDPRSLARCFDNLVKKAGLPRTKLHAMRHMATTFMKELKVDVKDAQRILGHANITTTLNIYQHSTPETQRTGLAKMGGRLLKRATC